MQWRWAYRRLRYRFLPPPPPPPLVFTLPPHPPPRFAGSAFGVVGVVTVLWEAVGVSDGFQRVEVGGGGGRSGSTGEDRPNAIAYNNAYMEERWGLFRHAVAMRLITQKASVAGVELPSSPVDPQVQGLPHLSHKGGVQYRMRKFGRARQTHPGAGPPPMGVGGGGDAGDHGALGAGGIGCRQGIRTSAPCATHKPCPVP